MIGVLGPTYIANFMDIRAQLIKVLKQHGNVTLVLSRSGKIGRFENV